MSTASQQLDLFQHQKAPLPKLNGSHSSKLGSTKRSAKRSLPQLWKRLQSEGEFKVVELATREDITHLLRLGRNMQQDSDFDEEVDPEVVMQTITWILADQERKRYNCFILYKYDTPIGFMVASCSKSLYNQRVVAQTHLWFVEKEHRGLQSLALLHHFEEWGRVSGATHLYTGSINLRNSERLSKLLELYGYPMLGAVHMKEVK